MSVFPQFGIINDNIVETITNRIDNNIENSKLVSWIRISSAAKPPDAKSGGLILESNLIDASFENDYGGQQRSGRVGIDFNKNSIYADNDRKHRPSPTIDSITIENGSEGLSRKVKFTIRCYTLKQAEILSGYFLEPGFTVLVEYGWNTQSSFNQRADLTNGNGACEIAKFNSYNHIISKRVNSNGEYDGLMGYITNGGYASADGESYEMSVEVTTLGEIPAYLQIHKNGIPNDSDKYVTTGLKFNVSTIEDTAENEDTYGLSLFQRMFNRLPSEHQTYAVKSLSKGKDVNGTAWTDPANFINMDPDRREDLSKDIDRIRVEPDRTKELNIADGMDLFTEESYIRLELAFAILNTYTHNVKPAKSKCSGGVTTYNYTINTNDTILRAHDHIFSTDASKLYIPNTKLPSFYLAELLTTEEKITSSKWSDVSKLVSGRNVVDGCIFQKDKDKYSFPSTSELDVPELSLVYKQKAQPGKWGYLRNLYINFDFFVETIKRTNMVAKDCYYELLNGISSAVNSYWMFEIVEVPNNPIEKASSAPIPFDINASSSWNLPQQPENRITPKRTADVSYKYQYELAVRDTTFTGDIPTTLKDKIPKFYARGGNSPFISSNINMDLPAILRNQILGQRSSQFSTQGEGQIESYTFFSDKMDPVMDILDSFKAEPSETVGGVEDTSSTTPDDAIQMKTDIINQKATIIPLKISYIGATGNRYTYEKYLEDRELQNYMLVSAWNDTSLLKSVEIYDNSKVGGPPLLLSEQFVTKPKANSQILAIDFSFEIHGNSGIKVGDVFKIVDIPHPFKNGVFQVMETSHSISGGIWTTNVTTKMRNVDLE